MAQQVTGLPGVRTDRTATHRKVLLTDTGGIQLTLGRIIDGSLARDSGNTGDLDVLRAGMVMGKITSGGKYAPAILGVTDSAYTSGVTLSVSAAVAVEINRRIGSSGTFDIAGPPTANGDANVESVAFSAVNVSTGDITVTALANNYVSGSFIMPDDGSEDALGLIGDGYGIKVTDQDALSLDVPIRNLLIAGLIDSSQIVFWPSDTGLQQFLVGRLNTQGGCQFIFDHLF